MSEGDFAAMQLMGTEPGPVVDELAWMVERLAPNLAGGARVLELGCGPAVVTRQLAGLAWVRSILALEVDAIQHAKNLAAPPVPGVTFAYSGAEAIPAEDASADVVVMLKSLHHVPLDAMDRALGEVRRVLRPGGVAWISEPVFAGAFNAIIRLFNDEEEVRQAAFEAVWRAVAAGTLELVEERFVRVVRNVPDFATFERGIIGATYKDNRLSPEVHAEVKRRFEAHLGPDGATFDQPLRIDVLRRPVD